MVAPTSVPEPVEEEIRLTAAADSNHRTSRVMLLIGYGVAIVCLIWVLHDIRPAQVLHDLSNVDWKWVALGMLFDVISYGIQGVRWKLLLKPFGRVRLTHSVRAVYAGLFANLVFPLRPGEVLRSYLLADSEGISFGRVLGSVGVERLIDLVEAVAALGVVSMFVPLPDRFKRAANTLGIVALALVALMLVAILYLEFKLDTNPDVVTPPKRIPSRMMRALVGLHAMGTSPSFYPAILTSLLMPCFQVLALWAMMRSYGLNLHFLAAVVVLFVINLGVSLPNAPANVGSYQLFCVLGLSVFQVDKTQAAGFSIFVFVALTLPFLFLGFVAILRSGLSLRGMREQIRHLPDASRPSSA